MKTKLLMTCLLGMVVVTPAIAETTTQAKPLPIDSISHECSAILNNSASGVMQVRQEGTITKAQMLEYAKNKSKAKYNDSEQEKIWLNIQYDIINAAYKRPIQSSKEAKQREVVDFGNKYFNNTFYSQCMNKLTKSALKK